jgi:transcriptional regulator with XRE-family HTH domain
METTVPPDLGRRIRAARELRGWTQEQLGQRISELIGRTPGYGKAAVNKWEDGTTAMPPGDAIWAMEQLFGIPYDLLLWGPDKKPVAARRPSAPLRSVPQRKP